MKMVIYALIGIGSFIALLLLVALFVPKQYAIQREIVIARPKQEVFNYIKLLRNQDYYSKWVMTDPAMKKTFTGTDGTVGFVYAWDGNKKAGQGEQELKRIMDGESTEIEVRFLRPFEGIAKTRMETKVVSENHTSVTWGMKGGNKYPLNLMHLFVDSMLGKDIEASLNTLKGILENKK